VLRSKVSPGNGLVRAVHLTTAAVCCGRVSALTWSPSGGIRNRPVWRGFFQILGRRLHFCVERFASAGVNVQREACR
jgi:hypothetical protein